MTTALVTGAGIRVGAAIARCLAHAGYDLVLHANRSRTAVDQLAAEAVALGRQVHVVAADLSRRDEVQRLAREVLGVAPSLDVVVHNAGIFEKVSFEEVSYEAYDRMQHINLAAPFFLTQALLPALRAASAPCVVAITDIGGERPVSHYSHYSVSKAGLIMLTKALAVELAPQIRVNAVSPGTVLFPESFDAPEREKHLVRVPARREGSPDDIARAVLFLVRDAPYVTGHVLNVDGGRAARL